MSQVYRRVGAIRPGRSLFDLSYEKKFTCDMGQLVPIMCDEVVPGDFIRVGNQSVIRMQPLVSPVLHEINQYVHYFFVPYRLLWDDWEDFISGGVDGDDASVLPTWTPTDSTIGSLWDYLGFPTGVDPDGAYPLDFVRRAYNLIYNEYYRDQTLIDEVGLDNESILNRCWEKDYFTSELPWQQRGVAPALPLSGDVPVLGIGTEDQYFGLSPLSVYESDGNTRTYDYPRLIHNTTASGKVYVEGTTNPNGYPNIRADLTGAATFDVSDLRLAFQIQKWMERNARAGARYTEFLASHFGVSPRDDRLQRPEYIGGSKSPIIVSEVLQTSSTDGTSPQGNLAGHGISVNDAYCGKCSVQEYGLIIGIMSVMPRSLYQQGINRQWLRRSRFDFYFPEFANLSEQAVEQAEIYCTDVESENLTTFGYQGRYDEMRTKQSMVCGLMRTDFDYWHMSRQFSSAPVLDETFVVCNPRKDIFAAPSEPGLIVSFGNLIKAYRPIPIISEPGLIDHN